MTTADELRERFGALGADDVAALDHAAVAGGVSVLQLMELAGFQVARCAWTLLGERPGRVVALAGRGNNGGDALVAARHLATWGCEVVAVVLSSLEKLDGLPAAQALAAERSAVSLHGSTDPITVADGWSGAELVLDGILGTGLSAAPREPQATVIRALNAAGLRVLSIDIPSGMDATTGDAFDPCVRAAETCTLAAMKAGMWRPDARESTGEPWVADIGMPSYAWQACSLPQPAAVRGGALLPVPSPTSH